MNGAIMLSNMLEMSDSLVRRALEGLTDADLIKRPSDQDNTIGWLIWHKTRVEDIAFADASARSSSGFQISGTRNSAWNRTRGKWVSGIRSNK